MAIPTREEAVRLVRQRTDLLEVVGRYVKLKRSGSNYLGLCPFHEEKTPSFSVSPAKGFFHCFGCKASGDVFTFLMKMEGKNFPEVLEELAARAGVELPRRRAETPGRGGAKKRLLEVSELAARFFEQRLWNDPAAEAARRELARRGIPEPLARRFRLGYAPSGWQGLVEHLRASGADLAAAETVGLVGRGSRGPFDLFRNRLMFAICDLQGRVIGFGGRRLQEQEGPKYINSRQSPIYDKSRALYGLAQARPAVLKQGRVVLVEGYFDVLGPVAGGIENVVATCGTALTEAHASGLRRLTDTVVTVFDGDAAGWSATERAARQLLAARLAALAVTLPAGEDPDSLVRERGAEEFRALLERARPAVELLAEHFLAGGDDSVSRGQALRRLAPVLAACSDPLQQAPLVHWVADRFSVPEDAVRRGLRPAEKAGPDTRRPEPPAAPAPSSRQQTAAENLLLCLLAEPELLEQARAESLSAETAETPVGEVLAGLEQGRLRPEAAEVLAAVSDAAVRARLSQRLLEYEQLERADWAGEFRRWLRDLRSRRLREQLRELTYRIGQAERQGRRQLLEQLVRDKIELERRLVDLEKESGRP